MRVESQRFAFRHKKNVIPKESGPDSVDYKNVKLLSSFVSDRGKIIPSRVSGMPKKHQRVLSLAIKRARHLALLPYVVR